MRITRTSRYRAKNQNDKSQRNLSAMSSAAVNGSHVLVYPIPRSGHVIPLLDLTHRLLTRGLTVTVLVTQNEVPLLQPLISTHSSSSLKPLVVPVPEIPLSTPFSPIEAMKAMRDHHEPALIQWFKSQQATVTPPVVAIISDFMLEWTHDLAGRVGVKRIVFSPSGACDRSFSFALWKDPPKKDDPNDNDDSSPMSFPNLPNSPIYPWWQLPPFHRNGKEGDPSWERWRNINLADRASWGFVFNTFAGLESRDLEHLKRELGHDRVWAVGPLLPDRSSNDSVFNRGGTSSLPHQQVMAWLDSREDNSVVYVCFGSRVTLTSAQVEVLTAALEQSRVQFIFCAREPREKNGREDSGAVSEGFEDRVRDRGLVIRGWAPQLAILSHRAVGAFLTHCGWNSVLEGLAAGAVMLTWPMGADQYTNAKLVVEQAGAGVPVGEGTRTIPDPAELARLLVRSLEGSNGTERVRAREISRAAMEAVAQEGSSDKDLDELVNRLNELSR
ncbi:UDP-glucuronosyl/UDP-glucosyltransferase [Trema orientale]|uniref:UDP-glucuronosyl/UDP-glucosyltransferase n=1 Tax=Trema orientale TaxID=63057 RepID=A0A2P5EFL0_TREOI|nr:UDP-glucuronosyl/UDP-glucosyltransferase [Trema orientale]